MAGAIALSCVLAANAQAVVVEFVDFSNATGLSLQGHATIASTDDGSVLRLTPAATNKAGTAFGSTKLNAASFSTAFTFRISNPGGITDSFGQAGGDGFTFIVQNESVSEVGGLGIGLAISGISPSIAVEFDTYANGGEVSTNHLGIDINGNVNSVSTANVNSLGRLDDGQKWTAWIDYDGTNFEVRLSRTGERPTSALLTHSIDLVSTLDSASTFVGFTASTGGAFGNHDILSWAYSDTFINGGISVPSAVPEPGALALLGLGVVLLLGGRRLVRRAR